MPLSGGHLAFTWAGTGPEVLLLIHGLGGNRQTWRHLISALARTHTVIAPDLPGHGESDPPAGDYSLGAHASAVRDLLLSLRTNSSTGGGGFSASMRSRAGRRTVSMASSSTAVKSDGFTQVKCSRTSSIAL